MGEKFVFEGISGLEPKHRQDLTGEYSLKSIHESMFPLIISWSKPDITDINLLSKIEKLLAEVCGHDLNKHPAFHITIEFEEL